MILSNITVPLLGLVDTAVIGHLDHAYYLGGSTVGAMIITFITWLCGFLRMSTTGLAAQAYGASDKENGQKVLLRGLLVAIGIGVTLIVLQQFYLDTALWLAGGSKQVQHYARIYSEIRIWGLPAALANLVVLGWLLGNHKAKAVMWLLIFTNLVNLSLDLWFVLGLNMGVAGVALATLIAEYSGAIVGLVVISKAGNQEMGKQFFACFDWQALKRYFSLNRDILIRTLCLEICFVFITFQGARLGDTVVAANAILMNFVMLISFGLDGIANGAEALVGQAKGKDDKGRLKKIVSVSLFWTAIFALVYSVLFILFGQWFIEQITSIEDVIHMSQQYLIWIYLLPVIACWCYLYDGVYIGLTEASVMRNSMLASTFLGFFPIWFVLKDGGNHAIWGAFLIFMALRGVTLAWHFHRKAYP